MPSIAASRHDCGRIVTLFSGSGKAEEVEEIAFVH
jgi:hypothetical protein